MSTAEELRERIRKFTQKAAELLQQENFQSARAHQEQVKILQTQLDLQKQLDLTGGDVLPWDVPCCLGLLMA